ncbi:MAG: hypothetical protein PUF90_05690 [Lachnospiraceae bacterium]|nr:hypothetical protein [Lachnospiraceae bacterium]
MADTIKADRSLAECISSLLSDRFTKDPVSDIRAIYEFLETADSQIRNLLLTNDGNPFRERFFHSIFASEKCAFHSYCTDTEAGRFTEAYLNCIPGIYENYRKSHPDDADINGLAEKAAEMVMKGIGSK